MKTAPFFPILLVAVGCGCGLLAARWIPPLSTVPAPISSPEVDRAGSSSDATTSAGRKPTPEFDGTLAGLLRIAKEARSPAGAHATLFLALEKATALQLSGLVKALTAPSRARIWYETATRDVLLQRWAEQDASAALKWAAGLPKRISRGTLQEILKHVAALDPARAIELAKTLVPAEERTAILAALAEVIAESNPETALQLLNGTDRSNRHARYRNVFQAWAQHAPEEAWNKALTVAPTDRYIACQEVLGVIAAKDPQAALGLALSVHGPNRAPFVTQVFATWAMDDAAAAYAAARALPSSPIQEKALSEVLLRWAATDGPGALQSAQGVFKGIRRDDLLRGVFQSWASDDPAAAAAALVETKMGARQKRDALSSIINSWGVKDPHGAWEWARAFPTKDGQSTVINNALYNLSIADLPAATLAWKSLPTDQRRTYLSTLVSNWASADTEGAIAFARSLESPQERLSALSTCASHIGFNNPETLSQVINEIPAGPQRNKAIRSLVGDPFGTGASDAVGWIRTLAESDRLAAFQGNSDFWSEVSDPIQLKALLDETPALIENPRLWENTARGLAANDPSSALQWAQGIESPTARMDSISAVLREWARNNPVEALTQAHAFTNADLQKSSVRNVIETWATQEPEAVLRWASSQPPGEERNFALLKGSLANAESDPAASAQVVAELLSKNEISGTGTGPLASAAAHVAQTWFTQNMQAGTQWVLQLPEGSARVEAVSAIAGAWTNQDAVAASAWVKQLPPGDSRDAAASALSQGIRATDPESAFAWAVSIGNPGRRDDAIRAAAETWGRIDQKAALTAIQTAPLSENVRSLVVEHLNKHE